MSSDPLAVASRSRLTAAPTGEGPRARWTATRGEWVCALAASRDGRWVATSEKMESLVLVWDRATHEVVGAWKLESIRGYPVALGDLAFSPDGRWLAGDHAGRLVMFPVDEAGGLGRPGTLYGLPGRTYLGFREDGDLLYCGAAVSHRDAGDDQGGLAARRPASTPDPTGEGVLWAHPLPRKIGGRPAVGGLQLLAAGDEVWTLDDDGRQLTRRGSRGEEAGVALRPAGPGLDAFAVHPGGRWVAWAQRDRVTLASARSGQVLGGFQEVSPVHALAFSADGEHLLAGGGPVLAGGGWRTRETWLAAYRLVGGDAPRLVEVARRVPLDGYLRDLSIVDQGAAFLVTHGAAGELWPLEDFLSSHEVTQPSVEWVGGG